MQQPQPAPGNHSDRLTRRPVWPWGLSAVLHALLLGLQPCEVDEWMLDVEMQSMQVMVVTMPEPRSPAPVVPTPIDQSATDPRGMVEMPGTTGAGTETNEATGDVLQAPADAIGQGINEDAQAPPVTDVALHTQPGERSEDVAPAPHQKSAETPATPPEPEPRTERFIRAPVTQVEALSEADSISSASRTTETESKTPTMAGEEGAAARLEAQSAGSTGTPSPQTMRGTPRGVQQPRNATQTADAPPRTAEHVPRPQDAAAVVIPDDQREDATDNTPDAAQPPPVAGTQPSTLPAKRVRGSKTADSGPADAAAGPSERSTRRDMPAGDPSERPASFAAPEQAASLGSPAAQEPSPQPETDAPDWWEAMAIRPVPVTTAEQAASQGSKAAAEQRGLGKQAAEATAAERTSAETTQATWVDGALGSDVDAGDRTEVDDDALADIAMSRQRRDEDATERADETARAQTAPAPQSLEILPIPSATDLLRESLGWKEQSVFSPAAGRPSPAQQSEQVAAEDIATGAETRVNTRETPRGRYTAEVERILTANWNDLDFGGQFRSGSRKGAVTVLMRIRKSGRVADVVLTSSSGDAHIDHLALKVIPKRFGRFPSDLKERFLILEWTFRYSFSG